MSATRHRLARASRRLAPLALSALLVLGAGGCPDDSKKATTSSRVNAAAGGAAVGAKRRARVAKSFCDVAHAPGKGPLLSLPSLADGASSALPRGKGALWVNIWATWCKPCIAEMPLLRRWPPRLNNGGLPVRLMLLSADSDAAALRKYEKKKRHRGLPPSKRIADAKALGAWLTRYGLSASTSIPVHLFVGADRRVRCVRAAKLTAPDYPRVATMIAP